MSDQTSLQLSIVDAQSVDENTPQALMALRISQRSTIGQSVSVCAVGDIGLSGRAAVTAKRRGEDALFAEIAPCLRGADVAFGNLEYPLTSEIAAGKMFAAPIGGAAALRKAGFKLLHLANNHVGEYGQTGLAATLDAVRKADMTALGAGDDLTAAHEVRRTDVNGVRIGWLGCGRTLLRQNENGPRYWEFDEKELLAAVVRVRSNLDVLIVSIHTGLMYLDYPRPEHKVMAEELMAAGADLILMHHAHVLQGVQLTSEGQLACYNLGNFLLDWREGNVQTPIMLKEQNEGAVFRFVLDRQGVAEATALPIWLDDDCRVHWAIGSRGKEILDRLVRISRDLEGDFVPAFERQRAERNTGAILKVIAFHARRGNWAYVLQNVQARHDLNT